METILEGINSIGGPVVAILLLLSVAATTLVLLQLWQWIRFGRDAERVLQQVNQHLDRHELNEALLLTRNRQHPRLQTCANTLTLHKHADLNEASVQQEARRLARTSLLPIFRGLRPLEVIATIAPLLGLFGTVLGMIEAFRAMEAAGAQVDPSVLSGGIWQALLTTAYGLGVAIPASLLHSTFERKAETEVAATQNTLEQLLFRFSTASQSATDGQSGARQSS